MRKIPAVLITLVLSGCHALYNSPQPLPAPMAHAQEIDRAQSGGLSRLGMVSVTVQGSPDDAERALAAKANAAGARYYQILGVSEKRESGVWYATAILYGAPAATAGTTGTTGTTGTY